MSTITAKELLLGLKDISGDNTDRSLCSDDSDINSQEVGK